MEIYHAIILGIVQGLTEFLPVSSSGHLAVVGNILKINPPGVLFEAMLHAGTALAIVFYFREKILNLSLKDIKLVVIGSIPVGLIGILLSDQVESLFSITKLVGIAFLVTAFINFQTDRQSGKRENIDTWDAIVIGIAQAFAVLPGISRSGSTIFAGSKMNLSKTTAAEYSFLLSLPAILGANFVEYIKHGADTEFSFIMGIVGLVTAFIFGLLAISFLLRMLTEKRLKYFSVYLLVVGVITILFL